MSNNKPRRGSRGCVGLFLLALGAYFVSSIFTSRSPPLYDGIIHVPGETDEVRRPFPDLFPSCPVTTRRSWHTHPRARLLPVFLTARAPRLVSSPRSFRARARASSSSPRTTIPAATKNSG